MTDLLVADLHVSDSKFDDIVLTLDYIVETAKSVRPTRIIFLGDFFDFAQQPVYIQDATLKFIYDLHLLTDEIHFIIGNHDVTELYADNKHACVIFKYMDHVIVHSAKKVEYEYKNGYLFIYVPYFKDDHADRFVSQINDIIAQYPSLDKDHIIIYGHFSDSPSVVSVLTKINALIFSGHIHYPTVYGDNFVYVGSVRYIDFKDVSDDLHGVVELNFNDEIKIVKHENYATPIYKKITSKNDINLRLDREYYITVTDVALKELLQTKYPNIKNIIVQTQVEQQILEINESTKMLTELVQTEEIDVDSLKSIIIKMLEEQNDDLIVAACARIFQDHGSA